MMRRRGLLRLAAAPLRPEREEEAEDDEEEDSTLVGSRPLHPG